MQPRNSDPPLLRMARRCTIAGVSARGPVAVGAKVDPSPAARPTDRASDIIGPLSHPLMRFRVRALGTKVDGTYAEAFGMAA